MSNFPDPHRRSGRTTRLALAYVNECIQNPDKIIKIENHTGLKVEAVRLTKMVEEILDVLDVQAMVNIHHCLVCVKGLQR